MNVKTVGKLFRIVLHTNHTSLFTVDIGHSSVTFVRGPSSEVNTWSATEGGTQGKGPLNVRNVMPHLLQVMGFQDTLELTQVRNPTIARNVG